MKRGGAGIIWALAFEIAPAAIFGGAVAFSTATALASPALDVAPISGGAAAFGCAWLLLRRLGTPARRLYVPEFDLGAFEPDAADLPPISEAADDLDELVLEDPIAEPSAVEDELILEDALPPREEDTRVVQLFKRDVPTAGELQDRIEHHLRTTPRPSMPDASQELHEALAALRRSLR